MIARPKIIVGKPNGTGKGNKMTPMEKITIPKVSNNGFFSITNQFELLTLLGICRVNTPQDLENHLNIHP